MEDIVREFRNTLLAFDTDGRACEQCDQHLHDHDWADMDFNGFVVYCSFADAERLYE